MKYNPYDLLPILLNGHKTYGRPVEFNSTVTDQKSMKNHFGEYVKPIKISTTCNECGQGYVLAIDLGDPPFGDIKIDCPVCKPVVSDDSDVFVDPVAVGVLKQHDLDSTLLDLDAGVEEVDSSVADRINIPDLVKVDENSSDMIEVKATAGEVVEAKEAESSVADRINIPDLVKVDENSSDMIEVKATAGEVVEVKEAEIVVPDKPEATNFELEAVLADEPKKKSSKKKPAKPKVDRSQVDKDLESLED
jgi:hypothetical protein